MYTNACWIFVAVLLNIVILISSLPKERRSACYSDKLVIADIGPCVNEELGLSHHNHHRQRRAVSNLDIDGKWSKDETTGLVNIPIEYETEDANVKSVVDEAIKIFNEKTCIRIKPKTSEVDFIKIISRDGCYSQVGRQGGEQLISMQSPSACLQTGFMVHEFLHALGFYHEMRRCDRDQYVTVNFPNIWDNRREQYKKFNCSDTTSYGLPYDTTSILHYGNYASAIDYDVMTITSNKDQTELLGQSTGMSPSDIEGINRRYDCTSYMTGNSNTSNQQANN